MTTIADDLAEALRLGRDAVLESFDYIRDQDDQLLADARLAQIDTALSRYEASKQKNEDGK